MSVSLPTGLIDTMRALDQIYIPEACSRPVRSSLVSFSLQNQLGLIRANIHDPQCVVSRVRKNLKTI